MIKKLLQSRYSLLFLIVFIVLLYVTLNKFVVPFIISATDSSLFVEQTQEEEQLGKVSNERTQAALGQCKLAMKNDGVLPEHGDFVDDGYEAWALGNGSYVIRSSVSVAEPNKGQVRKYFACKIQYRQGDPSDVKNWSIMGIDFSTDAETESEAE
ncbi:MAG: hypothetical protein ACR2HF_08125 [Methylococcaceae bacterium]